MKKIGITLGDPGGIGPEVVFKSLSVLLQETSFIPIIFGYKALLGHPLIKSLSESYEFVFLETLSGEVLQPGKLYFVDAYSLSSEWEIGKPCEESGQAAYAAIDQCVKAALEGHIQAMVTAPICKESLYLAHFALTDHTTLLAHLTQSPEVSMAFYTPRLKTVLTTVHVPYTQVPQLITESSLRMAVMNSLKFTSFLGIDSPRIAVAGLNPHAGESGMFGREEIEVIEPAIDLFKSEGLPVSGPYPADTLYYRAYHGAFDIVVSLYHDQGLIPIKLLAFDEAVNITLGLPFIRTSPDHGTAFDIAYQGQASPHSFIKAIQLALKIHHV